MIFVPEALLALVALHAAKHGVPVPVSVATTRAIVAEATQLADGCIDDEPAALFYACARRAKALGGIGHTFFEDVARAQAAAVGLILDASALDLVMLRGQISFGVVHWEGVRPEFTRWLHAPGRKSKRTAPKRPR